MIKSNRTRRPNDLRRTIFKHSLSEGRDCSIEWAVDFGRMEIQLYVSFISPALIIDCLWHMARYDERFQLVGISTPLQMSRRFNISLCVEHGESEVWYKLTAYEIHASDGIDRLEIELAGMPDQKECGKVV